MNNLFSARSTAPGAAAWAIVLLTLVQLGWLQFRPESSLQAIATKIETPSLSLADYREVDEFAAHSGAGNVFIKIVGASKPTPDAKISQSFSDYRDFMLSVWYFRTSYNLYPRRAYLAPADVVINGGWDMMGLQFVPDPSWIQTHDVRSILTLGFDELGRSLPAKWEPIPQANTKREGN